MQQQQRQEETATCQIPTFATKGELRQALFEAGNGGFYLAYYTDHWDELPESKKARLLGLPEPKCMVCEGPADFRAWVRQTDSSVMVRCYCNKCAEKGMIPQDIVDATFMTQGITRNF